VYDSMGGGGGGIIDMAYVNVSLVNDVLYLC